MAENPNTLRKRILSVTPPNADKSTNVGAKNGKDIQCSPKLVQDTKKRVVEANKGENAGDIDAAGNDPDGSGQTKEVNNMADLNKNTGKAASATAVSANDIKSTASAIPVNDQQGEASIDTPKTTGIPESGQRVTRSAVRRGRPRRSRGLSVDSPAERLATEDNMMEMLQTINSTMANSELQRARFENNIMVSLDTKLSEIKNLCDSKVDALQTDLKSHDDQIKSLHVKFNDLDVKTIDLEVRVNEIDDDISACRMLAEGSVTTVNEYIGQVETSLAKDIEQIRESAEVKINEQHENQRKLEDRMQDMTKNIEAENRKLNTELETLKTQFVDLQALVNDTDSVTNSKTGENCSKCSYDSCGGSSSGSVFSEDNYLPPPVGPNRLNANRSLIIDGVLERPFENLAALSLHFVTDMGISLAPDDIEVAFRLGQRDPNKSRPRPVKLVLKNEIIRDQIFHFKKRLRQSRIFSSLQLSLDQERDVRVKMGILKRAANNARAQGREVYSQPHQIKIDGVEYDTSHTNDIPVEFLKPNINFDPRVPLPPVNARRLTVYERARKMSERAVWVSTGLQKTAWGLLFFSAGCFLSNFYKCNLTYQGFKFKSLEQAYQAIMAKTCNQPEIFQSIMESTSPAVAKSKTSDMPKTPTWLAMKVDVMRELLFCKFRQNRNLYYKLLNTRPHALYECTLDEFWGTGCRLGSVTSVEGDWCGKNQLGTLLMHTRDILVTELEENQMIVS